MSAANPKESSLDASRPPIQERTPIEQRVEPVWRYVEDAVGMSFEMEHRESSVTSSTEVVIRDLMEIRYGLAPTLNDEKRVNRGSLSTLEFRSQCASVRRVIEQPDNRAGLSNVQRCAVLARFAHQVKRALGVQGLFEHFSSLCNSPSPGAVKALIWSHYMKGGKKKTPKAVIQARGDWSLRALEKEFQVSKSTLGRDLKLLAALLHKTEGQGLTMLDVYFRGTGLVGEFE